MAWTLIGFLVYRRYKKMDEKPMIWKILLVIVIGMMSFSIHWNLFDTLLKLPILPLGVWVLYGALNRKEGRWDRYRSFAWIGFLGNFIFLASALISIPFYSLIYPEKDPSTYITDAEGASLIRIHQSGVEEPTLNRERLVEQIPAMKQEKIYSEVWYGEMYDSSNGKRNRNERFPYQLLGASTKWGSGLDPLIYVEEDGKGILFTTSRNQFYYQFKDSIIEEGM
jgi:hypothetical protein